MRSRGQSIVSATSISTTGVSYVKPLVVHRTQQELEDFRKEISTDAHEISLYDLLQR